MTKPIAKQKTVGKDLSVLKRLQQIDLTAMAIYSVSCEPLESERLWEPKAGTQLHRIWKLKKLNARQQRGWRAFRQDAENAYGKSGAVTSAYGDYHDKGGNSERVPVAFMNQAQIRIDNLMRYYLIVDEAALLRDLLKDDVQKYDDFNIELIGFLKSEYKQEETARANGIGHIQTLLTRVGRFYSY